MNKPIKRFEIKASRWPWQRRTSMAMLSDPKTEGVGQKYGWRQTDGMGRFGGGWNWALGFESGGWRDTGITIMFNLLFGMVTVRYRTAKGIAQEFRWKEDAERRKREREEGKRREADLRALIAKAASAPRPTPTFDENEIPF
jgi:hypothetical protein